jgi:hypothetical protein
VCVCVCVCVHLHSLCVGNDAHAHATWEGVFVVCVVFVLSYCCDVVGVQGDTIPCQSVVLHVVMRSVVCMDGRVGRWMVKDRLSMRSSLACVVGNVIVRVCMLC